MTRLILLYRTVDRGLPPVIGKVLRNFFFIFPSTKSRATTPEKYDGRRQTAIRHGEGERIREPKYQVGDDSNRGEGTDSGRRTDTTHLDVKNDGTTSRGREERESCQKTQPTESELGRPSCQSAQGQRAHDGIVGLCYAALVSIAKSSTRAQTTR